MTSATSEPILCNTCVMLPRPGYLERVRDLCDHHGIVLIFDEVITGFRVGLGGAQGRLGVTPDLAVLAKALGGGYPVAALVGKRRFMELLGGSVLHGGTYNANGVSTVPALATLEALAAANAGVPLWVQGVGQAFNTTFGAAGPITNYREYARTDLAMQRRFVLAMQERGVRVTARGTWFLSAAHTDADIDATLTAARDALATLRDPPTSAGGGA